MINKKWMGAGAGALAVLIFASFTVLDTKIVEIDSLSNEEVIVESIESTKGEVLIDSFVEAPEAVRYMDATRIEVSGRHKTYGEGVYEIDLNKMQVTRSKTASVADPQAYTAVLRSEHGLILVRKDGSPGLYQQIPDGSLKKISGNFIAGDNPDVKLADSGDKLIYMVRESAQIATYNLTTYKKKVISGTVPEYVLEDFQKSVTLSPDGGYFAIYDAKGSYQDHTINVYGADSGRQYVDEVMGTCPKWSPDGKRLGFIYSGQLADGNVLAGTRVGYILFPEKDVVYFDLVAESQQIAPEIYWSHDAGKMYFLRTESDTTVLRAFDVASGLLYSNALELPGGQIPSQMDFVDDMIVMYWAGENAIQICDANGAVLLPYECIDTISTMNGTDRPYAIMADEVGFYKDGQICLVGSKTRETLGNKGVEEFAFSGKSDWVITGRMKDQGYELAVIARKKP